MRAFLFFFSLLYSGFSALCQITTQPVSQVQLQGLIHYKGKPVTALRFTDTKGSILLLTTQTGIETKKGSEDNRSAHLYAYTCQSSSDSTHSVLLWQMTDGIDNCPLDVVASFVEGTPVVTDLDKNGIAEVWLMYRTACRGDVSPAETKIIMHEGNHKYAMRGKGRIQSGGSVQPDGGTYLFDEAFQKGAVVFRRYAEQLWKKHATETVK